MKIIINTFYSIFVLLLLGVAGLFLVPLLPIDNNIQIKIVESGSMEPAIKTGALVTVIPTSNYQVDDVITFKSESADVPTTHRIARIEEKDGLLWFATKGDANEEEDTALTPVSSVIGKVAFSVPYAGFILDFARQPIGFLFLIVLPAVMIILGEIEKIWREIRNNRHNKNNKNGSTSLVADEIAQEPEVEVRETVRMIEIGRPISSYETITHVRHLTVRSLSNTTRGGLSFGETAIALFGVVTSVCFASLGFIGSTVSYFNDTEATRDNMFIASAIDFAVIADGETYYFTGQALDDKDGKLISVVSPAAGSVGGAYRLSVEKFEGSDIFCSAIVANATAPFVYDGPLLSLDKAPVLFDGEWSLELSLDDTILGYAPGDECIVDLVYTSWDVDAQQGTGYSDEERVRLEFYAPVPQFLPVSPEALRSIAPPSTSETAAVVLPTPDEIVPSTEDVVPPVEEVVPEDITEMVDEMPITT